MPETPTTYNYYPALSGLITLDALLAKASVGKKIPVRTLFDIIKD